MDGPKLWGARIRAMAHIWAHRGPPASPNPHAACPGPGGWGTPRGTQPLGCPSAIPNTPGRGQGFTPWLVCPPHMSSATSASPRGPHTHKHPRAQGTRTVSSSLGATLCVRAPIRSSAPYTRSPGHSLASSSLPRAWSLHGERRQRAPLGTTGHYWALLGMAMAMGTATTCTPYRGQGHLPVVVGGEDGSQHHLLPPDDLQQLEGARSSRR